MTNEIKKINTKYRICLSKLGSKAEDLLKEQTWKKTNSFTKQITRAWDYIKMILGIDKEWEELFDRETQKLEQKITSDNILKSVISPVNIGGCLEIIDLKAKRD